MSDNTPLNVGTGGDTIRDIDRSGVKTQVVTLDVRDALGNEALIVGAVPVRVLNALTYIELFHDTSWGGKLPGTNPFAVIFAPTNDPYGL